MDKAEEKRKANAEADLDNEYSLKFTKRELMIIFHWLAVDDAGQVRKYSIADGAVLLGVMQRIQPLAAVETNIEKPNHVEEKPPLDLGKKETN